jgi:hypothetical protein
LYMQVIFWLILVATFIIIPGLVLTDLIITLRGRTEREKAAGFFERFRTALSNKGIQGFDEECLYLKFESARFRIPALRCLNRAFCIVKPQLLTERDTTIKLIFGSAPFDNPVVVSKIAKIFQILSYASAENSRQLLYKGLFGLFLIPVYGREADEINMSQGIPRNNPHDKELLSDFETCSSYLKQVDLAGAWATISKWREISKIRQLSPDFHLPLALFRENIDVIYEPTRPFLQPEELARSATRLSSSLDKCVKYLKSGKRLKLLKVIIDLLSSPRGEE